MDLREHIRDVPDFPHDGILFRDITPLLGNARAFRRVIETLGEHAGRLDPGAIVGIEARGFLFGGALAARLELPFVPLRKPGKLPAAHWSVRYSLEYGHNQLDIHQDAWPAGTRAYVVDDLLATGGTAEAAAKLVKMAGGEVAGFGFVIELLDLRGRVRIDSHEIVSLISY